MKKKIVRRGKTSRSNEKLVICGKFGAPQFKGGEIYSNEYFSKAVMAVVSILK